MEQPRVPKEFLCDPLFHIEEEEDIEKRKFSGMTVHPSIPGIKQYYRECFFEDVTFEKNKERIEFVDCIFHNCDLSHLDLSDTSLYRVQFKNCRMFGINFSDSTLKYCGFYDCILNYSNFFLTKMDVVEIEECVAKLVLFNQVTLKHTTMLSTNFEESEFVHTSLSGLDFTSNEIRGIKVTTDCLKGLQINEFQALDLVRLLGVTIK